jgi:hypothetical protein
MWGSTYEIVDTTDATRNNGSVGPLECQRRSGFYSHFAVGWYPWNNNDPASADFEYIVDYR